MKQVVLSERQMSVLMNLGRALDDALTEFRGKTVNEVATVAHSAYSSMTALQLPSLTAPSAAVKAPARKRAKKRKTAKVKAKTAKTSVTVKSDDRTVRIISVLNKAKEALPASGIAEKLGISGQGLGPILNKMHGDGVITKREVDGSFMWGPKPGSKLNGKSSHVN